MPKRPSLANTLGPALAAAWIALSPVAALAAPGSLPSTNVAWLVAAADADIERAFGQAKAQKKPVLLYWGATWCPPCNQLKATLFNRQEFAAQSKHFVAVFVDGDRPAAQKLGARFKVSGYPTLVLFTPQGQEITRLPGEADAPQVLSLLEQGLAGGRPIAEVLADARAGKALSANEWRMLSFHSWAVDDSGLVARGDVPGMLADLAVKAQAANLGDSETGTRLWLKALAASDDGKGLKPDAALAQRVERVLTDSQATRTQMDVIGGAATEMVKALSTDDSAERATWVARFDSALLRLQNDATLSRGDRIGVLIERVNLARIGQPKDSTAPKLPAALVAEAHETATRLDREITDGYERQAVIPSAGYLLGLTGQWTESDALLKANLTKSHSPYYIMLGLAGNARKLGRTDESLNWYQQAWEKSVGPATRIEWGVRYVNAMVDLAPKDAPRIEKAAAQILSEANKDAGSLHDRSGVILKRMGKKLAGWNAEGKQAAVLKRLQPKVDALCVKAAAGEKAACKAMFATAPAQKAKAS